MAPCNADLTSRKNIDLPDSPRLHDSLEDQPHELAESFAQRFSLRQPAVRAAAWQFASYLTSQGIRFGSNLVLTRLLVPEDFALMLLVNLFLHGLQMFSDIGLGPALIQKRDGIETRFLHTAWTISLGRGAFLWGFACLLAWPIASFYGEPRLLAVMPVAAFSLFLDATCSTYVVVLERRLQYGQIIFIELFSYLVSVAAMIIGALYTSTVWPLVGGLLINAGLSSALTHVLPGAPRMRLLLDRKATSQMVRFGKWLFVSSMLTFLAGQLDRIILGKLITVNELGVYAIAFMIAQVMVALTHELARGVLYPVYARAHELGTEHLRSQVLRYRLALLAVILPPSLLLYLAGPEIVRFLYDDRYWEAGWMLQSLSLGAMLTAIIVPAESILLASGDSYRHMLLQAVETIAMCVSMALGYHFGGTPGIIIGYSLAGLLQYPFLVLFIRPYGVWLPKLDLTVAAMLLLLLAMITEARGYFHLWGLHGAV